MGEVVQQDSSCSNSSQSTTHSWFVSSSILVPTKNVKSLTPLFRGTVKFWQDRDRRSKIADVTIPYSNCSQSIKDSWFVYSSTRVPTTNAKSYTPLLAGEGLLKQCWVSLCKTACFAEVHQLHGLNFMTSIHSLCKQRSLLKVASNVLCVVQRNGCDCWPAPCSTGQPSLDT